MDKIGPIATVQAADTLDLEINVSSIKTSSKLIVFLFPLGSIALIVFALTLPAKFGATTKAYPFVMGFVKLFFLGTFGEILKYRFAKGTWILDKVIQRAVVWGVFGLWFTMAFAGFSALVGGLVSGGFVACICGGVFRDVVDGVLQEFVDQLFGHVRTGDDDHPRVLQLPDQERLEILGVEEVCGPGRRSLFAFVYTEDFAVLDSGAYFHICHASRVAGVYSGGSGGCTGIFTQRWAAIIGRNSVNELIFSYCL